MTKRETLNLQARSFVLLDKTRKAKFISGVIWELTIDARAKRSENPPDDFGVAQIVEGIHRACGYLIKLLDGELLAEENLLAEMLIELVTGSPGHGMKKLLANIQVSE